MTSELHESTRKAAGLLVKAQGSHFGLKYVLHLDAIEPSDPAEEIRSA